MNSLTSGLDENIFSDVAEHFEDDHELVLETPPSSPSKIRDVEKYGNKPSNNSLFSLAQVSLKINELWSSARERVFGEDYWIPTDQYEVAFFPPELLTAHKVVYPPGYSLNSGSQVPLTVVQGSIKNEPATTLHHVVYTFVGMLPGETRDHCESLTIYRSTDVGEALDFCRRCEECRALLRWLDKKKDVRKAIRDITNKFQAHPLWRMVHIAISCGRADMFTDDGLNYLKSIGYSVDELINTISSPEGQTPLMHAIETNQLSIRHARQQRYALCFPSVSSNAGSCVGS
uniref:Uncharacterized protein n=1 Tax=Ditylenchus dipsaci TaxID=166011 RepID=A0A915DMC7_9BILA